MGDQEIVELVADVLTIVAIALRGCKALWSRTRGRMQSLQRFTIKVVRSVILYKRQAVVGLLLAYGVGAALSYTWTGGISGDAPLWAKSCLWTVAGSVWVYALLLVARVVLWAARGLWRLVP